jgi:Ni,Fe-hydrogenase maturation factor
MGTHQLPLSLLIDFLSDSAGQIVLIGIQPGRVVSGEEISPETLDGANRLVHDLVSGRIARIPVLE